MKFCNLMKNASASAFERFICVNISCVSSDSANITPSCVLSKTKFYFKMDICHIAFILQINGFGESVFIIQRTLVPLGPLEVSRFGSLSQAVTSMWV